MSDNPFAYGTGDYGDYFYGKDPYNSMSGSVVVSATIGGLLQRVRPFSGALALAVTLVQPVLWRVRPFSGSLPVTVAFSGSMLITAAMAGSLSVPITLDGDAMTVTPLWNPIEANGVWTDIEEVGGTWVPVGTPPSPWS